MTSTKTMEQVAITCPQCHGDGEIRYEVTAKQAGIFATLVELGKQREAIGQRTSLEARQDLATFHDAVRAQYPVAKGAGLSDNLIASALGVYRQQLFNIRAGNPSGRKAAG